MIKKKYSYFVSYQLHNGYHKQQCHAFYESNSKIVDNPSSEKLRQLITADCKEKGIECEKVIFTSITLLSTKWVWK